MGEGTRVPVVQEGADYWVGVQAGKSVGYTDYSVN